MNDKKEIALVKMFTGNYWKEENNIGYESINMFLPDNSEGENYVYFPANGEYAVDSHPKIEYVLLTKTIIGNNKAKGNPKQCVQVLGVAKVLEQTFKNHTEQTGKKYTCYHYGSRFEEWATALKSNDISHKDWEKIKNLEAIHKLQCEYIDDKDIAYGGKKLYELYKNNELGNSGLNIYITLKVKTYQVKEGKAIYLYNNAAVNDIAKLIPNSDNVIMINMENCSELSSTSQTTYLDNGLDIISICDGKSIKIKNETIPINDWFKPLEHVNVNSFNNYVPSLAIAKQQYNELAYSNNFEYFFKKYPNLWKGFMDKDFSQTTKSNFTVVDSSKVKEKLKDVEIEDDESGEKRQLVNRELKNIDLLIVDGKDVIVIENKIRSGINGYKINDGVMKTQLDKYYEYVKKTYPEKEGYKHYFFIFTPNYNTINVDITSETKNKYNEKQATVYKKIYYSELYKLFQDFEKSNSDFQLKDFAESINLHAGESDTNYYNEMKRRLKNLL